MNKVRISHILAFIACILFLTAVYPIDSYAQRRIFLNQAVDGSPSGITNPTMKVGEIITIDVWFEVPATSISGISLYLTFDETVFKVIDQKPEVQAIRPFDMSVGLPKIFSIEDANRVGDPNSIPKFQISVHSNLSFGEEVAGGGRFTRFQLEAVGQSPGSEITVDFDPGNSRATQMFFLDSSSRDFGIREGMTIEVVGVNVEGIPDVLMQPGQTLIRHFNLDSFLTNPPDDFSTISWIQSPNTGGVTATLDESSHDVSFAADSNFTGTKDFRFTVRQGEITDTDTMSVIVSYKPEVNDSSFPNSISFDEDKTFLLLLDTLVTDIDDPDESLTWEAFSDNDTIAAVIDTLTRIVTFSGEKDYFGSGNVQFIVTDPQSLSDSITIFVLINAVNDPPVITGLPDIHLLPLQEDSTSIDLDNFTTDVDNNPVNMSYGVLGNTNVEAVILGDHRVRFSHTPGFRGTETLIFSAEDPLSSVDFDTITVTVGPKPPRILSLPDTTIQSINILSTVPYVNLDNFVEDDDNLKSSLTWSAAGTQLQVTINQDRDASFVVPARMHAVDHVIFNVSDNVEGSDTDTVRVIVVDNGRPLIHGLPDKIFVPLDTIVTVFDLDSVVTDIDTPLEDLIWTATGQTLLNISINPVTHIMTVAVPANAVFAETITIRVTDPESHFHEHELEIQPVAFGIPILLDIPDVGITKNKNAAFDLDDYLIILPEEERDAIRWSVAPVIDPRVSVQLNPETGDVLIALIDEDFASIRTFTFTATNTNNNASASDDVVVNVTRGDDPILGQLPDITFVAGETSKPIELNKFVIDPDTPDDSLEFSVIANNVRAVTENLRKGANHRLIFSSNPGFTGSENVIVTVTDIEGNFAMDTIRVVVTSNADLTILVIPNPASVDYIDILILSTDTLDENPSVFLTIGGSVTELGTQQIPGALTWKGDHTFTNSQIGDVKIVAQSNDNAGSTISDSILYRIGNVSKVSGYAYTDEKINFTIAPGAVPADQKVMILNEHSRVTNDRESPEENGLKIYDRYYLGPATSGITKANFAVSLQALDVPGTLWNQLGIYHIDQEKNYVYLPGNFGHKTGILNTEIFAFGRYVIAADLFAPVILSLDYSIEGHVRLDAQIVEKGSGIRTLRTIIDNREYYNTFVETNENEFFLEIKNAVLSGQQEVFLYAEDYASNISGAASISINFDDVIVPETYELKRNFPNPFNPSTKIEFRIPVGEFVALNIYNVQGQLVRSLIGEFRNAGTHTVEWNGRNSEGVTVASGIYIYSLKTKNFSKSQRMLLIK